MTDRLYSLEASQVGLPEVTVWCPRECLSAATEQRRQSHLLLFIQKSALREKERDPSAQ